MDPWIMQSRLRWLIERDSPQLGLYMWLLDTWPWAIQFRVISIQSGQTLYMLIE